MPKRTEKGKAPVASTTEASSVKTQPIKEGFNMSDSTEVQVSSAIAPDLEIIAGQITTTSQQVAAHFNKAHRSVLLAIRRLECSDEFRLHNFVQSSYLNEQGKEQPCYRLTRDGFTFLAMGFTGKDAAQWKEAYITAFNKMEKELLARMPYTVQPGDALPKQEADQLRTFLENAAQKLPLEKRGSFLASGWGKLKAHTGVNYRKIPRSAVTDALSLLARHVVEWELVDDEPKITANAIDPTDGPAMVAAHKVSIKYFRDYRTAVDEGKAKPRIDAIPTEVLQGMVVQALMQQRMLVTFNTDTGRMESSFIGQDDFITTWPRLVRDVATGECMCTTAELIEMASACMQRLQQRKPTAAPSAMLSK